jgi:hypothetical protein
LWDDIIKEKRKEKEKREKGNIELLTTSRLRSLHCIYAMGNVYSMYQRVYMNF